MPKRVIALGFFDGVHLGHAALLRQCVEIAHQSGLTSAAISFDSHPSAQLSDRSVGLLSTPEERFLLMRRLFGLSECILLPFDDAMMHLPWDEFVRTILAERYEAAHLVCGADYRFGHAAAGTAELLQQLCAELGIGCSVVPQVQLDDEPISSTRIRLLLARGEMEAANRFLGHPYCLTGPVLHGKGLGHTLGFPTANLAFPDALLRPALGVYACRAHVDGAEYSAVVNLGLRPTVEDADSIAAEAWLLDFSGDLYGKTIRLDFFRFLRAEQRFDSLDALQREIFRNAEQTRTYFAEF